MTRCACTYVLLVVMALAAPGAWAQQRPASKAQKKRPPATKKAPDPPPPPDLRAEAAQLGDQLKLLVRFVYLYGRISPGLETADDKVERSRENKSRVVANINNVRAGLEKLQADFHARPELQRHSLKLQPAIETAAQAERLASSGKFDEAGRTLIQVAHRLIDILAEFGLKLD